MDLNDYENEKGWIVCASSEKGESRWFVFCDDLNSDFCGLSWLAVLMMML